MLYLIVLLLLLTLYVATIFLMKKFTKTNLTNIIFLSVSYLCYLSLVLIVFLDVGINDWNFLNTLPTANVSPFMFSILPIYFVLPKTIKKYFLTLISLLSVGMLISVIFSCFYNFSIGYKFHPHFLLDYVAHMSLSLWGIYLVKSKQIALTKKECFIGGLIIVAVAFVMMILNVIFDTSFFGLSLNGKHNIYNKVLVENSYLSALIYFCGLTIVLVLGFLYNKLLNISKKATTISKTKSE